jgi:hypothetical protein
MKKKMVRIFLVLALPFNAMTAGNDYLPVGARSAAMGNASLCLEDACSAFNNQAELAFLKKTELAVNYENPFLLKEIQLAGLACAIPFRKGAFGLSLSSFGSTAYLENTCGIAYAFTLGKHLAAAIQLDYFRTQIGEGYGDRNALAGEIGLVAPLTKNLKLGAHLRNPGRTTLAAYDDERFPTTLRIGFLYSFSSVLLFAAESEKDSWHPLLFRGGLEYNFASRLFFRAGLSGSPTTISFGTGYRLDTIRIDFSAAWHPILGFSPGIGLVCIFSSSPS